MAEAAATQVKGGFVRIFPVKNEADHKRALKRLQELFDAVPNTPEGDEHEILMMLVSQYEKSSIRGPSPIEAIKFRLQQTGQTNRALEPYLGSRSRVSEIMSGERRLTVDMMRALHLHFGIPAEALLGAPVETPKHPEPKRTPEPSARALAELVQLGVMTAQEKYFDFLARARTQFSSDRGLQPALRKTRTHRTNAKTDVAALHGWCAGALLKSFEVKVSKKPKHSDLNEALGREIARLSSRKDGLKKIGKLLADHGIALVLLKHLTGTYLDGAAMRRRDGIYVIALTLRYDRIDNFWFTLMHEFAHVALHLKGETDMIVDDLEIGSSDEIEAQADVFAQRSLIPDAIWKNAHADLGLEELANLADLAGVSPAVVAGRWQREFKDYRKFSKLVGHGCVREVLL